MNRTFTESPNYKPNAKLKIKEKVTNFSLEPDNHFLNILSEFRSVLINEDYLETYSSIESQAKLQQVIRDNNQRSKVIS